MKCIRLLFYHEFLRTKLKNLYDDDDDNDNDDDDDDDIVMNMIQIENSKDC